MKRMPVVLMRPLDKIEGAVETCISAGLEYVKAPAIELQDAELDESQISSSIGRADFVVFMSEVAVRRMLQLKDVAMLNERKVIAVGRSTASGLALQGVNALIPEEFSSEGVVSLLSELGRKGQTVVVFRSMRGNSVIREGCARLGMQCIELALYDIRRPSDDEPLRATISSICQGAEMVLPFSSSMMVRNFFETAELMGAQRDLRRHIDHCSIWAIGRATANALHEYGVERVRISKNADYGSMLREIAMEMSGRDKGF